jgi:hypothetical protein
VVSVSEMNATLQVQINEPGTVYALAQLSSTSAAATPTIQEVRRPAEPHLQPVHSSTLSFILLGSCL